jgi:hypothetical protein
MIERLSIDLMRIGCLLGEVREALEAEPLTVAAGDWLLLAAPFGQVAMEFDGLADVIWRLEHYGESPNPRLVAVEDRIAA